MQLENLAFPVTPETRQGWASFFNGLAAQIPTELANMPISKHAEAFRILPKGDRYPGKLNLDRSPYLREILDNMNPYSGVRHTVVMKGTQIGLTLAAECVACYYLGYHPADQIFVAASSGQLKRWISRKLEPAINSYGYREKIFAQDQRKSGKQTGDSLFTKQYVGGQLDLVSALSAADLRSTSKRVAIRDEIDGAKEQLDTGEGSFLDVSEARLDSWGLLAKLLDISSPTLEGRSAIAKMHALGDQRRYYVPCPYCGEFQVMVWPNFKAELSKGLVKLVFYQCEHCERPIKEEKKPVFLNEGEWRPTEEPKKIATRSYHIPRWYAPLGVSPWTLMFGKYLEARGNAQKLRTFVNLTMGLPFRDRGSRQKPEKLMKRVGTYKAGTVPDGVLFLTAFVDVQQGSSNDPNYPARLEMEVRGHGIAGRTWSITYKIFHGDITDPYTGAWGKLTAYGMETKLTYKRADGMEFPVKIMFVDSRDGTNYDIVYRFTEGLPNTYPTAGFGGEGLQRRKDELADEMSQSNKVKGDVLSTSNFKRFRMVRSKGVDVIQISTNHYKTILYNNLNVDRIYEDDRKYTGIQRPGFCDFPNDPVEYGERYFRQLTAEDKLRDGSFKAYGRRNEALDCASNNLCAADFFLQQVMESLREKYKKDYPPDILKQKINIFYAQEYLAKLVGVDYDRYAGFAGNLRKAG